MNTHGCISHMPQRTGAAKALDAPLNASVKTDGGLLEVHPRVPYLACYNPAAMRAAPVSRPVILAVDEPSDP
jgi:hypothetical protein